MADPAPDLLGALQRWYESHTDGDWEHSWGVRIETLDNPGWSVTINLEDTELEGRPFVEVSDMAPERDWYICRVVDARFEGHGGPLMLGHIIQTFLDWAATDG